MERSALSIARVWGFLSVYLGPFFGVMSDHLDKRFYGSRIYSQPVWVLALVRGLFLFLFSDTLI